MVVLDCLLPVSNSEAYLEECIESILSQSFQDYRLLIFDDASIDNSSRIVEKYLKKDERIKFFQGKKTEGIAASIHKLIHKAKAKYSAIQLPYDTSSKSRFEKQLKKLQNSSLVALGSSIVWDGSLVQKGKTTIFCTENPKDVLLEQLYSKEMRGLFMCSAMYLTEALKKNPLLNTQLLYDYDIEFHAQMQRNYPLCLANLKEPLYSMRLFHGCIQEKVNLQEVYIDRVQIAMKSIPLLTYVKKRYFDQILMTNGYRPF